MQFFFNRHPASDEATAKSQMHLTTTAAKHNKQQTTNNKLQTTITTLHVDSKNPINLIFYLWCSTDRLTVAEPD